MSAVSAAFLILLWTGGFFKQVGLCEKIEENTESKTETGDAKATTAAPKPPSMSEDDKTKLMWYTLCLNFIRGYQVSNLETASAFMLETIYDLSPTTIGFIIGILFLLGVP